MIIHKSMDDLQVGDSACFSKTVTETDALMYVGATGDFSPIHVDEQYSQGTRFGHRIAPGIMVAGMITAVLGNDLVGCDPISVGDEFRFKAPIYYGDTITAEMRIVEKIPEKRVLKLEATCTNQNDVVVLTAKAVMVFPKPVPAPSTGGGQA
ncbi:MAG TPA: MaoC family dehydratase [Chloroflexota bacterium]|nr:MaoC family dehydratase [Chloroflexota bacterium]